MTDTTQLVRYAALSAVAVGTVAAYWSSVAANKKKARPPCVAALPFVGSLPFMPTDPTQLQEFFATKTKELGSVFAFYAGQKYAVVLNTYDAIQEALVKKSLRFAGRNPVYVESLMNVENHGIVFKQYSEEFKVNQHHIITVLKHFGFGVPHVIERIIQVEAADLVQFIKETDGRTISNVGMFEKSTLNVVYSMIFGNRLERNDPSLHFISHYITATLDVLEFIIDVFPLLAYVPPFRKRVQQGLEESEVLRKFLTHKITECENSSSTENFIHGFLEKSGKDFNRDSLTFIVRDLLGAAVETTASLLNWCMIYLGNNPAVQKRLQEDIDSVVGKDRWVGLDDKVRLPLVEATMLEVLRLRPTVPFGVPHQTLFDTTVEGFTIPKDTWVTVNLWGANTDPNAWTDPNDFIPDRFLNESGAVIPEMRERMIAFSLDKRQCTGETLARQQIFIILTSVLQHFDILPPEGETKIRDEVKLVRVLQQNPFDLRLVPRQGVCTPKYIV